MDLRIFNEIMNYIGFRVSYNEAFTSLFSYSKISLIFSFSTSNKILQLGNI